MLWNTFLLALREIRRNVMRSFLTILGIVIGVAAVIVMVTLGGGATAKVSEQIASLGSNLLIATPGKRMGPGQISGAPAFKVEDAEAIAREVPGLAAVAPASSRAMTVVYGNQNWSTMVSGSTDDYFAARNWTIQDGRRFSSSELRSGAAVCIIGATVKSKLFGSQDPIGDRIRLQKMACQVIGVLDAKGQSTMGTDQDDLVLIPLRTFQRRIAGNQDVNIIQVSAAKGVSTDRVKRDIEQILRERRHIPPAGESDFNVMDMKEITKMLTGTTQILTALLGAVAAVSLLVGGIGIMNIMLVSVTERTREIGVRRAIGAKKRNIMTQFIMEAVVLCQMGGVAGVLLGVMGGNAAARILKVPMTLPVDWVVIGLVICSVVGIIFGSYPAWKAANLDPIDSLRHE